MTNNSLFTPLLKSNFTGSTSFQSIWLIVRIVAGVLMIHNGFDKIADISGFADNVVAAIGLPYPVFLTYCAAYIEIVGAILLALGFLTRLSAIALFLTMLVAIYFHIQVDGLSIRPLETAFLYALIYFLFTVNGGGLLSLDTLINQLLTRNKR
ncbi:MAG: DoxX family protein [Cyanobacteria bacterium P01_G01_bin.39]